MDPFIFTVHSAKLYSF